MSTDPSLAAHVRHALQHLYDPAELARNPLAGMLCGEGAGAVLALRSCLIEAIEALRPDPDVSPESIAWRTHQVLSNRFVKQFSQNSVALTLNLSVRQMRRQEALALQELTNYIAARYASAVAQAGGTNARKGWGADGAGGGAQHEDAAAPEWPGESLPDERAGLREVLASVRETTQPLAEQQKVRLGFPPPEALPNFTVNRAALRQCLLNILAALIPAVPGGALDVAVTACDGNITFEASALAAPGLAASDPGVEPSLLELAARLAATTGGHVTVLEPEPPARSTVQLRLPSADQTPVLAIDDNEDALQLLRRFLACSRYQLVAAQRPEQALDLAAQIAPRVILLDVMMPGIDGWELLGRLRTHPLTGHIPVVLCSVLPQEQLALALGATAFLRKPLLPEQVLATLDRLTR